MELKEQLEVEIELYDYYKASCANCQYKYNPWSNFICKQVTNFPKRFSSFRCINLDEEDQHPFWEPKLHEKKSSPRPASYRGTY